MLGQPLKPPTARHDLSFGQSGAEYRQETIDALYAGFRAADIDFAVYMPDATMDGIEQMIMERVELLEQAPLFS